MFLTCWWAAREPNTLDCTKTNGHERRRGIGSGVRRQGKRDRLAELLASPKRRRKATAGLAHFRDLDPRFVVRLDAREHSPEAVARALRRRGAGSTCHIISENPELDGKRLSLEFALESVIGHGAGTLLSCVPGALAYFEGEAPKDRCILSNRAI